MLLWLIRHEIKVTYLLLGFQSMKVLYGQLLIQSKLYTENRSTVMAVDCHMKLTIYCKTCLTGQHVKVRQG